MFHLIDRYLFWHLLRAHIGLTLVLVMIIWLVQTLRLLAELPIGGDALGQFLLVSLLQLPRIFALCLAPTLLIVTLHQLVQKLQNYEYFALAAAGFSPHQIIRPIIMLSLLTILAQAILSFYLSPLAIKNLNHIRHAIKNSPESYVLQAGIFREVTTGVTFFAERHNADGSWQNILLAVAQPDANRNASRDAGSTIYLARNGRLTLQDNRVGFILTDGTILQADPAAGQVAFARYVFTLPDRRLQSTAPYYLRKNDMMIHQLLAPRAYGVSHQPSIIAMRAKAFELIGSLATPLIFVLIAFACLTAGGLQRRGYGRRITLAIAIAVVFQAGLIYCANLANQQNDFLLIILWPSLVLLLVSMVIFWQSNPHNRLGFLLRRRRGRSKL